MKFKIYVTFKATEDAPDKETAWSQAKEYLFKEHNLTRLDIYHTDINVKFEEIK
jgi:hypothetical protein